MRLSSLEIKGFKSFGDKVIIHFDKGVTSIVGPNGSGKSNVVDAIRWVLGEQKTRMLRSEKMENIIFNGTKNRKPANLAEVSLTFQNTKNILPTEFTTVTITRKLYRSGESEYELNGVSCRLKDITDLFLDTGIGSDSYSIIELKMIDEILNDKHNTIKLLFEEAAGISKYKIRKKQTFQKLEETEADLNRVNDLLFELEKNMKTLESQAKKTEKYYRLRDEYKVLSVQLAGISIQYFQQNYAELQGQDENQVNVKAELDAKLAQTEAEHEKIKLESLSKEKDLGAVQKVLNEKLASIGLYESDKKIKNERLKFLQDRESNLNIQLNNDKTQILKAQDAIKVFETEKETESSRLIEIEALLNELKAAVDKEKIQNELVQSDMKKWVAEEQKIQSEIHQLEKNQAIQQTQKQSLLNELERLNQEKNTFEKEILNSEEQFTLIGEKKADKEEEFAGMQEGEEDFQQKIRKFEQNLKELNDELIAENRKLDAKQNEFNLTKSMIDNLEGYPESIKFLKKNASQTKNAPLLSDIITCKQEYKAAIENFLEPYMNYFIVDNILEAQQAINLLNEASKGRAYFFMLEAFNKMQLENKNIDLPNCLRAIDLIEIDDKYKNLCHYLLNDVMIMTAEQESITSIDTEKYPGIILLSQNGKFYKTDISLSGGSIGLFDGKRIGRVKNLEKLSTEIKALESHRLQVKSSVDTLHAGMQKQKEEARVMMGRKNQLQNEISGINNQYFSLRSKLEQQKSALLKVSSRIAEIDKHMQAGGEGRFDDEAFLEKINSLKSRHAEITERVNTTRKAIDESNYSLSKQSNLYNQQNIVFVQQQNKITSLQRDLSYQKNLTENLSKLIGDNGAELEKVQQQVNEIVSNATDYDNKLVELYQDKENQEKAVAEVEAEYYKSRGNIEEIENNIRDIRKRKEQADVLLQSIRDKVTEIRIQLNSLKERLGAEFGIQIEDIIASEENLNPSEEKELRDRSEKIKNQLQNFGPINPMAVEAYTEIKERYDFIIAQKEDLSNARASLLQTIEEIDNTAKEKFMSAYTAIRENFINVFRSLFSEEDRCDLVLSDINNPLDAEINIIAQPKGKRPLSINQLSGGEKTLTATALLFGIYLLKPAPFCIFDEVDAPLDDTNIDKFNKIIKKFSQESQFIIITHNKRTMASTDIIYGVTMVEMGVTQLVPVDLREIDNTGTVVLN